MQSSSEGISAFRHALAHLSRGEQKDVFAGLPNALQAALWQDRLNEAIAARTSKPEIALLEEIRDCATPESYADEASAEAVQKRLHAISEKAQKVFDDFDVYNDVVTSLGEGASETPVFQVAGQPTCHCSSAFSRHLHHNDCGSAWNTCTAGGCTKKWPGCGMLWLWTCDGLCTS